MDLAYIPGDLGDIKVTFHSAILKNIFSFYPQAQPMPLTKF